MPTKPLVLNETVSTTNMLLTSIAENLAAIVAADSSNARLASLAKEIADEAKTVAMGATRAEVFDTTELMQNWLKDPENAGKLKIGDNLYIKDTNVPDYWVSNVLTNPNDEGYYYEYAQLEIGKVNLSNVVKTDADDADTVDSVFGMLEGTPKNISSANLASVVAEESVGNVSWPSTFIQYRDVIIYSVKKGKLGFNCFSGSLTNHPDGGRIFFFMTRYNNDSASSKVAHGVFSYHDSGSYVFTAYLSTSGEVTSLKISNVIAWA